jgi:type I restriction enzyme, S subunit
MLGEICDKVGGIIRTGPFGSQLHEADYQTEGIPVVMPKNIVDGEISIEGIARIGEAKAEKLTLHKLHEGDIVYGRRGDIGRRALITRNEEGWLCGTGCLRISLGNTIIEPHYLYYYLGQPRVVEWIYNQAIGATMPNLNTEIIRSVQIAYPPLPMQRKIAAILAAYDDLIGNNTRRIAILEEMAQALYREWFVHFRFPGHEKIAMVESVLGMIPEGWEVVRLGDVVDINVSNIRKGHEPALINYIDIASVSPGKVDKVDAMEFANAPGRARRIVKHGDIIWSTVRPNRRSYSMILDPQENLIVSTGFAVISGKQVPYTYLYYTVTTDDFVGYLTNRATGAAYPAVNAEDFQRALILRSPDRLLEVFHDIVAPMFDQKQILLNKNANLRRTRDLLLPRLIAGEIDVEGMEVAMMEGVDVSV